MDDQIESLLAEMASDDERRGALAKARQLLDTSADPALLATLSADEEKIVRALMEHSPDALRQAENEMLEKRAPWNR